MLVYSWARRQVIRVLHGTSDESRDVKLCTDRAVRNSITNVGRGNDNPAADHQNDTRASYPNTCNKDPIRRLQSCASPSAGGCAYHTENCTEQGPVPHVMAHMVAYKGHVTWLELPALIARAVLSIVRTLRGFLNWQV